MLQQSNKSTDACPTLCSRSCDCMSWDRSCRSIISGSCGGGGCVLQVHLHHATDMITKFMMISAQYRLVEMCRLHATSNTDIDTSCMWERRPDIAIRCFTHMTEMVGIERDVNMHALRPVVAVRKHSCWFKRVRSCRNMVGINPHSERQRVEGCKFKQVSNTTPAG